MMQQPTSNQPPRLALSMVHLFAPHDQAEAIPGDLLEEFLGIAAASDARRWYWRQTVKTVAHLFADGFRSPHMLFVVLVAGLLGVGAIWLTQETAIAILYRYPVYLHIHPYLFWLIYAIVIERFLVPLLAGFLAATMERRRKMVAVITLSLLFGSVGGIQLLPFVRFLSQWNDYRFPRPIVAVIIATTFLSPAAIVVGGCIARKMRSTVT
jgi:hypothetical protein